MTTELGHLLRVARRTIREDGITTALKAGPGYLIKYIRVYRAWSKVEEAETFDQIWGTDTTRIMRTEDFTSPSESVKHAVYYRATPSQTFNRILSGLNIGYEDFVFVDFGSGKGRTLLQASEFPFKQIIGVELEPQLHAIAQKNIQLFRSPTQKCKNFELLCTDATAYSLPSENSVFYFFDPFNVPILSMVLENIRLSLLSHPRKIFIVYLNPNHWPAINQAGFLTKIYDSRSESPRNAPEDQISISWHIYTNVACK